MFCTNVMFVWYLCTLSTGKSGFVTKKLMDLKKMLKKLFEPRTLKKVLMCLKGEHLLRKLQLESKKF